MVFSNFQRKGEEVWKLNLDRFLVWEKYVLFSFEFVKVKLFMREKVELE